MVSCKSVYDPQEDSTMLEKHVRKYAKGKVLDIGTGSGIQAIAAAQTTKVASVLATDVQKEVVEYCKKNIKNSKIRFIRSDLFNEIKGKFDTLIFNPPYLPQELKVKDLTIEGGKKGYEVIEKFLSGANSHLNQNGIILMVFSSLTRKDKVEEFTRNNLLEFEQLEKQHIFFEDLYVYLLKKNEFLKRLEDKGFSKVRYMAKGRRGILFLSNYRKKKAVIKAKNPKSTAVGRIQNEAKWLGKLSRHGIGPKPIHTGEDYLSYEYVDGDFILDYIRKSTKEQILNAIRELFRQMLVLDRLKIDKEEMHHPQKHVIISKKPCLLDFERAHYSRKPKNVTQLCQFIMSLAGLLEEKGITIERKRLMELAKVYKNDMSQQNFEKILGAI